MKTVLLVALLLFALTLTAATVLIVHDIHQDLADLHVILGQAATTGQRLDQTLIKANAAIDTLNEAADEERGNWRATSSEAAYTGRALRLLISRVDRSFVDGTLQHINRQTLPALDVQIVTNGDQLRATLAKLGGTADGVTAVTGALNARLSDPEISVFLGHLNGISANLETVSANSAAMSGDMKLAVHRLAQPPTKFHQFVSVAWTTARFGSLFVP